MFKHTTTQGQHYVPAPKKPSATDRDLSQFLSVFGIPDKADGKVTIFHTSFRDFIADPKRCEAHGVDPSAGLQTHRQVS
ncbi:hypothetical protein JB92DRAFT_2896514 [Gautieria morchelliformis]|nr:hypothetical protein JB92DRAFT_2896514 [Gautieria morchelliformis]